jgi:hypothetical protein
VCHLAPGGVKSLPRGIGTGPRVGYKPGLMGKRSHERLNARDRGRRGIPYHDTAADHGLGGRPSRPRPSTATLTAWLRRYHATVVPPAGGRPYWIVRQGARYLAAGRTPHRAIENAMSSRALHPPLDAPTPPGA